MECVVCCACASPRDSAVVQVRVYRQPGHQADWLPCLTAPTNTSLCLLAPRDKWITPLLDFQAVAGAVDPDQERTEDLLQVGMLGG